MHRIKMNSHHKNTSKLYAGILPFAINKGDIYYLLGRESSGKHRHMYSDFGGHIEQGETVFIAAAREGCEELFPAGELILGPRSTVTKNIKFMPYIESLTASHFLWKIKYDVTLPQIFGQLRRLAITNTAESAITASGHLLNPVYLEKDRLMWVKASHIPKMKNLRPHFRKDMINVTNFPET